MERFRQFLLVGGLPEAVDVWRATRTLVEVRRVHDALHQAYVEDLLKYGSRRGTHHLETILANAPGHYGARFKNRGLAPGEKDRPVAEALDQLERAMVLFRAIPTAARSLPLVARNKAARKLLPLDIGLALAQLRVLPEQLRDRAIESVMDGRIAEAFVGVQLLAAEPQRPRALSFWCRDGSSSAEVDFIVPTAHGVIPVEVKAGAAGSLKSLHRFLAEAKGDLGIRLCSSAGGLQQLEVDVGTPRKLAYRLLTWPLYFAERIGTESFAELR
jgi:predicted AAA+ superfamily ATPase